MIACDLTLPRENFELKLAFEHEGAGIIALFGPSGCGKTSVLRSLAGLEPSARGRVVVAGEVWQDDDAGIRLPPWQRRLGLVFQQQQLFAHLNVRANLLFGSQARRLQPAQTRWQEMLALLDLEPLLDRRPAQLSGGEARRVAIGRTLICDARLLLFDEPLNGLDAPRRAAILPYLERLHEHAGLPMVYVSHQLDEVLRLSDRMLVMQDGKLMADGATLDLAYQLQDNLLSVIAGTVLDWDASNHIATISISADSSLQVWTSKAPLSKKVRLLIEAKTVLVSNQPFNHSSLLNQLPCTLEAIATKNNGLSVLSLRGNGWRLKAQISQRSLQTLALRRADPLYAGIENIIIAADGSK